MYKHYTLLLTRHKPTTERAVSSQDKMTTVDFNTHYVPLLKEYTLRLTELFDDFSEHNNHKSTLSRSSIWNKLQNIMTSLTSPLLSLIVSTHVDLVEIILNNLSIDTFERNLTEWLHTCTCVQALLRGAGSNFWNIVCFKMSDITDDILEILLTLLPIGDNTSASPSTSSSFLHTAVIAALELMASLVASSDELSLLQTKTLLQLVEEIFARNCPVPTMTLDSKSDGVMIAISTLTQALVDQERASLININISTRQNGSERTRIYNTRQYNIIRNSSHFHSQLCDLVSSTLSTGSNLDTFKIQTTLLESSKWIGLISEDYLKRTDLELQAEEYKLCPLVALQHQSLGNLVSSIFNQLSLTPNSSSSRMILKYKAILHFIPYCLVSFNSHLKSTSLQLFQHIVEKLSKRCCYSRSWANPMQILDPLVDNDSFLTMSNKTNTGESSVLYSSSASAFKCILDACIVMTQFLDDSINAFTPVVSRPTQGGTSGMTQRSFTTSVVTTPSSSPGWVTASPLHRAASVGYSYICDSPLKQEHPYLPDEMLNILFVNAIAGVFSFYDRLRVILHTAFLHIGNVMSANKHINPCADDSVISWQELWCITLPSWEEHLRHLKLRRALFKNHIVPEVSSLPPAPQLVSKAPPLVVDLAGEVDSSDLASDPLRDYLKEIVTSSSSKGNTDTSSTAKHEASKPLTPTRPSPPGSSCAQTVIVSAAAKDNRSTQRPGVIRHLKTYDDTNSSSSSRNNSANSSRSLSMTSRAPSFSSTSSSMANKKHVVKGGSMSLREQLKARAEAGMLENRCGGIDEYGDDFAYEKAGSRGGRSENNYDQQYQPYRGASSFYTKNTTQVTDTYSYSSYRSTDMFGFDDLRKKSSKKRGTDSRETSEFLDDFTTKKKFHHVADSLDTFGEFNTAADLDLEMDHMDQDKTSSIATANKKGGGKPANGVLAAPDITALLGEYSSASAGSKATKSDAGGGSSSTSSQPPLLMTQKSIQDTHLTMMQKMAHVNIDDFYLRLLNLSLQNNLPSRDDLKECPIRFINEDKYISSFQPLLEAELDAMLSETIASNCINNRQSERQTNFQTNIYGPKSSFPSSPSVVSLPKVYVRCAMIQPRAVSSAVYVKTNNSGIQFITHAGPQNTTSTKNSNENYFSDTHSDSSSYLEEVRVAIVANPDKSASKCQGPRMRLTRDDLVVILDSNIAHEALDVNVCSMKDLLGLPHCLAVVVSQQNSEHGSSGNDSSSSNSSSSGERGGGEEFDQQTLVVLKDSSPPSSSTWLCVPFVSLSTHTREWKALHSIRSHSLLPLIPYLLQASPIISAERLQLIYRNLERGISSIVQIKKPKPRKENGDGDLNKCDDGYAERVRQHQEEVSSRAAEILHQLGRLALVGVDISVLSVTNMPDKLRALYKRKGLEQYPEITKTLRGIHSKWKVAIKDINRPSTIRGLKGGNVITASALGEGEDLQLSPPSVPTALWKVLARTHNETQLFAIKYVVSSMKIGEHESEHDTRICLIQGPPGTGKTRTILAMVSTLMHVGIAQEAPHTKESSANLSSSQQNKLPTNRILVCAPSNAAVDEVLLRLMKEGVVNREGKIKKPKLVRLGKPLENSPKEIIDITLENQVERYLQRDPAWKKLQKALESTSSLKMQLAGVSSGPQSSKHATSGGSASAEKRRKLRSELRLALGSKIAAELQVSLRRTALRKTLLETCDVLAGTLSAAGQYTVLDHVKQYDIRFETVLIDEAAQATEPATLIPLRYGCKTLVLVGDPRQLPAYVASRAAEKAGLGKSLFERLEQAGHAVVMLSVQYRMHPSISAFPSKQFYSGKLRDAHRIQMECLNSVTGTDASADDEKKNEEKKSSGSGSQQQGLRSRVTCPLCRLNSPNHFSPVTLFNIQGREEATGKSFRNRVETDFIFSLLDSLKSVPCVKNYKIGILSPYKGQVNLLRYILNPDHRNKNSSNSNYADLLCDLDIEVNTIDGFQGREKDIIMLSTVRCNSRGVGFLSDIRRLNVAITRAKRCLLIVGCSNTLQQDPVWREYLIMLRATNALVPGPRSGLFRDYQGYAGIMTTVQELVNGNATCTSSTTSSGSSGSGSSCGKSVDEKEENASASDGDGKNPVVMKRTISMLQQQEKQRQLSSSNACTGPVRASTGHISAANKVKDDPVLEEGELDESTTASFDTSININRSSLIGKKKRM